MIELRGGQVLLFVVVLSAANRPPVGLHARDAADASRVRPLPAAFKLERTRFRRPTRRGIVRGFPVQLLLLLLLDRGDDRLYVGGPEQ